MCHQEVSVETIKLNLEIIKMLPNSESVCKSRIIENKWLRKKCQKVSTASNNLKNHRYQEVQDLLYMM